MTERSYLSIGDVLSLLKDEFPDVTISKIRFLESQGLLDPERTPSGYRKFYGPDVDRLRWILQQQKEHFLPLKVIKDRLEPGAASAPPTATLSPSPGPQESEAEDGAAAEAMAGVAAPASAAVPVAEKAQDQPAPGRVVAPAGATPNAAPAVRSVRMPSARAVESDQLSLTVEELQERTGLDAAEVKDLERFGLIAGRTVAGTTYYDGDAAAVAQLAGELGRYGVEARHLRMYKTAAEREAGFFEQIVTPLLKQRNPRSRQEAIDTVHVLSALGERLRRALLRVALRDLTGP
jgi:DNA-binding transcriptional MerR regulator